MEHVLPYLIQAAAGAVGGNLIGALRRDSSVGPSLNTLMGAAGGLAATSGLVAAGYFEAVTSVFAHESGLTQTATGLVGGMLPALLASLFKRGN
jgi:hypothetical protein